MKKNILHGWKVTPIYSTPVKQILDAINLINMNKDKCDKCGSTILRTYDHKSPGPKLIDKILNKLKCLLFGHHWFDAEGWLQPCDSYCARCWKEGV